MNWTLIIVAFIAFSGSQTVAVCVAAWLTQRNARKAQEAAAQATLATHNAAEDAAKAQQDAALAQKAAADAARALVDAAKSTDTRLEDLKKIATGTHTIVNSQRTVMLRLLASLTSRIASENPDDERAQLAASVAEREATEAEAAGAAT